MPQAQKAGGRRQRSVSSNGGAAAAHLCRGGRAGGDANAHRKLSDTHPTPGTLNLNLRLAQDVPPRCLKTTIPTCYEFMRFRQKVAVISKQQS